LANSNEQFLGKIANLPSMPRLCFEFVQLVKKGTVESAMQSLAYRVVAKKIGIFHGVLYMQIGNCEKMCQKIDEYR
jgi:hypothetical protein